MLRFVPVAILFTALPALAQGPDCANPEALLGEGQHAFDLAGRVASGPVGSDICEVDLGPGIGDVFWQWTCTTAGNYRFEIATAFHTSLIVYDGVGCAGTLAGNKSGTAYSLVIADRQAGDQMLLQLGETFANPDAVGTLTIVRFDDACSTAADDALEDNDTYQTALPILPGSYSNLFLWRGDEDYYRVTIPGGESILVDWSSPAGEAVLRVMNDSCGEFTYKLMGPWTWTNPGQGAVELVLNFEMMLPASQCTDYAFDLDIGSTACILGLDDGLEDNDTAQSAWPLGDGLQSDLIVRTDDPDYYSVCVDPGQTLEAEIAFDAAQAVMDLQLIGAAGAQYTYQQNGVSANYTNLSGGSQQVVLHAFVAPVLSTCSAYDLSIQGSGSCAQSSAPFCLPGGVNSSGGPSGLEASFGSGVGSDLHLEATGGPAGQFGYFLVSTGVLEPGGVIGDGRLCLTNPIGRYNGTSGGTVAASTGVFDATGRFTNLSGTSTIGSGFDVPSFVPLIGSTITPGETLHFQLWHRDLNPGPTVNFSTGLSVTF